MSHSPFTLWADQACDATFTDPAACAARASEFERQITRRNRREWIAGLVQLPVWGGLAAFFWSVGEIPVALSLLLIGVGVLAILRNVARRAGNLDRRPEEPCREHLSRQYRRQYEALMTVPLWYIGPVVPGIIAFLATVTAGVAEFKGWEAALKDLIEPGVVIAGLFAAIMVANWWAAQRLKRELERIEQLA
jgi:hypothetical protein